MSSDPTIAELLRRVEELERRLAERDARIAELETELREWRSGLRVRAPRQKRRGGKNAKADTDATTEGKRKAGRAKGHPGAGRPRPAVIHHDKHERLAACPACGGDVEDLGVGWRHVVEDIVLRVENTEYHLHTHRCGACRHEAIAPLPPELGGDVHVGPQALALAAWMRFDMGQSVGKIARFFTAGLGLPWSAGSISDRLHTLTVDLAPVTDALWTALVDGPLVHLDETGWKEDGDRAWLWSGSNDTTSCFWISSYRDRESLQQLVPADYAGVRVTDGYTAYEGIPDGLHAGCWAHILRTARDVWEVHQQPADGQVFRLIQQFLKRARAYQEHWTTTGRPSRGLRGILQAHYLQIQRACRRATSPKLVRLGEWLAAKSKRYLLFLTREAIPLTNNAAERELRPAVLMRKTSFGSRNAKGSETLSDGLTLVRTLRKRGGSLFEFIPRAYREINRGQVPSLLPVS